MAKGIKIVHGSKLYGFKSDQLSELNLENIEILIKNNLLQNKNDKPNLQVTKLNYECYRKKCKEKGVRLTEQRRVIAKVMSESNLLLAQKTIQMLMSYTKE